MKYTTIFLTVFFLAGSLACNKNGDMDSKQTDQILVEDSLTTEDYVAKIAIRKFESPDAVQGNENQNLTQTRKGGMSEGDLMYQLVGDLSYIADRLSDYKIRTPGKKVNHTVSIDLNFPTKEAKENYLTAALDSSFNQVLTYYKCEPAGDIQQSMLTLSLSKNSQFEQKNSKVTQELIRDEFASEDVVDKKVLSQEEMILFKTDVSDVLHVLNQTTDSLNYEIAPGDALQTKKLSLKLASPFSEEKINNMLTGYGITFNKKSNIVAIKSCRLDADSIEEDLETIHYLRMLK